MTKTDGRRPKVALFGDAKAHERVPFAGTVLTELEKRGFDVETEKELAAQLATMWPRRHFALTDGGAGADLAVSVGGDGTFLRTAAALGGCDVPILGINAGRLGFLADVAPAEMPPALDALLAGDYVVERRTVIGVEMAGAQPAGYPFALNEVAVLKHDNSSLIGIEARVDGELLAHYMADGLIVCTPTGSTGYSLSVGGPILVPGSGTLCLAAVAPHSLSMRPVVLKDDVCIELKVESRGHHFMVAIDGRSESFPEKTFITLRRAPYRVGVVKITHKRFFDTLRDKLMWGLDKRA